MPTKEELKRQVCEAIDRRAEQITKVGETIRHNPELGFKEIKTARLVEQTLKELGLSPQTGLAMTGVRATMVGGQEGPTLALLGELDGLVVSDHPLADPETGAAHACGHNAQIAGLMGAVIGLLDSNALPHLAGRVVAFAVPAEEYGEA
jgi:metal-dependent amidase/aminoacylase/carboxypeptidase family protein